MAWYGENHPFLWDDPGRRSGALTHTSWPSIPDAVLPDLLRTDGHAHVGVGFAHTHLARKDEVPPDVYPAILAHESLHAALLDLAKTAAPNVSEISKTADRDLLIAHSAIDGPFWKAIETDGIVAESRSQAWETVGYLGRVDHHLVDDEDLRFESEWTLRLGDEVSPPREVPHGDG